MTTTFQGRSVYLLPGQGALLRPSSTTLAPRSGRCAPHEQARPCKPTLSSSDAHSLPCERECVLCLHKPRLATPVVRPFLFPSYSEGVAMRYDPYVLPHSSEADLDWS